jgi:hypothetical protein
MAQRIEEEGNDDFLQIQTMTTNTDCHWPNNAAAIPDDLKSSLLTDGHFIPRTLKESMKKGIESYIKTIEEMKTPRWRRITFAC